MQKNKKLSLALLSLSVMTTQSIQAAGLQSYDNIAAAFKNSTLTVAAQEPVYTVPSSEQAIDLISNKMQHIPTPATSVYSINFIPAILVDKNQSGQKLDVTLVDQFLAEVRSNARHYPPNFPSKSQKYNTQQRVAQLVAWIEPYASAYNASYDVLIRAAQLNGIARNIDLGSDYTIRGSNYVAKALELNSDDLQANLLYGIMLSEGGGFKEGKKYLNKAIETGSVEAEQTLAQSDLLNDQRTKALDRLQKLQVADPNNSQLAQQIAIVQSGKYYIWDLPSPNINIKAVR